MDPQNPAPTTPPEEPAAPGGDPAVPPAAPAPEGGDAGGGDATPPAV